MASIIVLIVLVWGLFDSNRVVSDYRVVVMIIDIGLVVAEHRLNLVTVD